MTTQVYNLPNNMCRFCISWTVDKLDLEVNKRRWTFYESPHSHDSVSRTPNTESSANIGLQSSPAVEDFETFAQTDRKPNELLYINAPSS